MLCSLASNEWFASVLVSITQLRRWTDERASRTKGFRFERLGSFRSFSQANGRTKKTHIGFGDDNSSRPLLLLLLCPERTFGSSSPACRSGKGRLHRWQGERRRCEAKERDKSRVQRLSTAKKRVVGGGSEGERWTSFSLTLFSLSLFDLPPSGQPRQQRSFSPCRRDQPRDKKRKQIQSNKDATRNDENSNFC